MRQVLEPLLGLPGLRTAALVTPDGVPIAVQAASDGREDSDGVQALAALATSWLSEVSRAVAPLAWDAPRHLVLRAARGTLIVTQAPSALLLVVLDGAASAEELRLPLEAAVDRLQRHLRARGAPAPSELEAQAPILPARPAARAGDELPQTGAQTDLRAAHGHPESERQ